MLRALLTLIVTFSLAGCVSTYNSESPEPLAAKIESHASFYVMLPADGQYGAKKYPGSGSAMAQSVVQALTARTGKVFQATSVETLSEALANARRNKIQYVFETTILNWEDRVTEWSGLPDKVSLKFNVYNTGTSKSLAISTASASSKWATLGGDHPQDLLPVMTQNFVDSLF